MLAYSRIDALNSASASPILQSTPRRFDRIAITSVFGDPLNPRTWSGAPYNLAMALARRGVTVDGLHPRLGRKEKILLAARHVIGGYGRLRNSAQILRGGESRRRHAAQVDEAAEKLGVLHVMHTGTFDLPATKMRAGVRHYLYCDHSWADARAYRASVDGSSDRALREYERLESESLSRLDHIFTFGEYVRTNIIAHYGIPAGRVTAVGSGMGTIEPFEGEKDYATGGLLFVAKHLFREKGGELLLEAFARARQRRPSLKLTVVGDERSRRFVPENAGIEFMPHVTRVELQRLFRRAALLAQPMLNDPWGQVYLEALISRTPVLGLDRHGLPEITGNGRYGFLAGRADPKDVSEAILEAMSDPIRLAHMGAEGQRYVQRRYSWDSVAEKMLVS